MNAVPPLVCLSLTRKASTSADKIHFCAVTGAPGSALLRNRFGRLLRGVFTWPRSPPFHQPGGSLRSATALLVPIIAIKLFDMCVIIAAYALFVKCGRFCFQHIIGHHAAEHDHADRHPAAKATYKIPFC